MPFQTASVFHIQLQMMNRLLYTLATIGLEMNTVLLISASDFLEIYLLVFY